MSRQSAESWVKDRYPRATAERRELTNGKRYWVTRLNRSESGRDFMPHGNGDTEGKAWQHSRRQLEAAPEEPIS